VKWFRQIATPAGIPMGVQSRDSRAGGATAADESCATEGAIQNALTHTNATTTRRYIRGDRKRLPKLRWRAK
jgi:integrase